MCEIMNIKLCEYIYRDNTPVSQPTIDDDDSAHELSCCAIGLVSRGFVGWRGAHVCACNIIIQNNRMQEMAGELEFLFGCE